MLVGALERGTVKSRLLIAVFMVPIHVNLAEAILRVEELGKEVVRRNTSITRHRFRNAPCTCARRYMKGWGRNSVANVSWVGCCGPSSEADVLLSPHPALVVVMPKVPRVSVSSPRDSHAE